MNMAKVILIFIAALVQANALDLNPLNWVFKAPQLGLEFASGVVGQVQDGMNKAGVGSITAGPLNAIKAGFDVPAGMVGQAKEAATGVKNVFKETLTIPQKIADKATSSIFTPITPPALNASEQKLIDAIANVQKQYPQLTIDDIIDLIEESVGQPAAPVGSAVDAEVAALKEDVDERLGVMVSTILDYLEELESLPDSTQEDRQFVREEIDAVLHRANELMGYVEAAKLPEQILMVVEQIYSDFSPLYDEARQYLSE